MKAEPPIAKTKPPRHSAPDKVVVKHVSSPVELPTNLARTNILANMTRDVPPPIQIRNQARIEQPIEQPAVSVPVVLAAQSEQRFGTVTSIEVRNHQTEVAPLPSSLLLNFAKLPETIVGEKFHNIADNSGNVEKIYGDDESYDFAQSVSEYNIGEVVPTVHDLADAPEQSPDYDWTELEFGLNAVIDDAIEPAETIEPSYTVEPAEMIGATAEQFADTVQQSIGSLLIAAEFAVFEAAVDITSEPTSKFIQSETTKPTLVEINDPVAEHEDFRQTLHTVIEQTVSERPERAADGALGEARALARIDAASGAAALVVRADLEHGVLAVGAGVQDAPEIRRALAVGARNASLRGCEPGRRRFFEAGAAVARCGDGQDGGHAREACRELGSAKVERHRLSFLRTGPWLRRDEAFDRERRDRAHRARCHPSTRPPPPASARRPIRARPPPGRRDRGACWPGRTCSRTDRSCPSRAVRARSLRCR